MESLPAKPLAVYIHWPFCKKKCPYCDFNSHVRDAVDHTAWRDALLAELRHWLPATRDHTVTSIFFGGGTPSLMQPATAAALIHEVHKRWNVAPDVEITLEANPTSVEAARFRDLATAGVNRVSLGVQSLNNESLKFLGREHSSTEALEAVALAQKIFPRTSFDLIYALPQQTLAQWEVELREALRYADGHLSLYQLTIEENTAFHHAYHVARDFTLPGEELAAELYQLTQTILEAEGLPAYEISNHARTGQESRHNLSYWRSHAYLGIGPGAHGRVHIPITLSQRERVAAAGEGILAAAKKKSPHPNPLPKGEGTYRIATRNLKSPERWLAQVAQKQHGLEEEIALSPQETFEEKILMGLRLREGLSLTATESAHLRPNIEKLQWNGLLEMNNDHIAATAQGRLLLNSLTASLLAT